MDVATNKITAFQIKPDLQNVFKSSKVKEMIQKKLQDTFISKFNHYLLLLVSYHKKYIFSDKTYKKESASIWSKEISDDINKQLAEQSSQKYKYVVTTVICEKLGQGCRLICRTRWDSESDSKFHNKYHSIHI